MRKINLYAVIIIATSIFLNSCDKKNTENNTTEKEKTENFAVISVKQFERSDMKTGKITLKTFENKIKTTGKISLKPDGKAYVNSYFSGIVKNVYVTPGQKVTKNQKLCSVSSLEIISLQQNFGEVSNKLKNLKNNYARKKSLHEKGIISDKEFEKAQSEYFSLKSVYAGLKQKILMMNINPENAEKGKINSEIYLKSPVKGFVNKQNCIPGQSVNSGDNLFEIINPESMRLEFFVFEKDISKIKPGDEVFFFMPYNDTLKFSATVTTVGKSVNDKDRTVTCYAEISKKNNPEPAENMFVNVYVVSEKQTEYALPDKAIVSNENESFVFKLAKKDNENYYFSKINLKPGISDNGYTKINLNDTTGIFLIEGAYNLSAE